MTIVWILTKGINPRYDHRSRGRAWLFCIKTTTSTVMDQLTHLIDAIFPDVEKFESLHRRHCYTLQSLYTALDHQLQDGLMVQHEFDRMRYVVRNLFDLKLQLHVIEAEPSLSLPADVIEHTIALMLDLYSEGKIAIHLCVYSFAVALGDRH